VAQAFTHPVDLVFHLASIPGGMAEREVVLGRQVNLDATVHLLEAARLQADHPAAPVFVFASTIAALGAPLPAAGVDDHTPCTPKLSYGAHKLIGEILVADYTRRGWVDGRSVRLSGIVARPAGPSGLLSAFMSDIIRELAAGRSFNCPVSADSTTWLLSVPCLIDNLLHAATMDGACLGDGRVCTLPALHLSMAELAEAVGQAYGVDTAGRVTWQSNPALEANFGRYPPLRTPLAEAAGFRHDGDARTLALRALHDNGR
jgi:nucleoside-diphosphate-sugar epimerase